MDEYSTRKYQIKLQTLLYYENLNKRDLQQKVNNILSDIDFNGFMKFNKKFTADPYSVLINNATLPTDNHLYFRHNLKEHKKIMTIDKKIRE